MKLTNILEKCKNEGHPMTAPGIYLAGKKYGFIIKDENTTKNKYVLDEEKFNEWLKNATEIIPEGWCTIKEISVKLGTSIPQIYKFLNEGFDEVKRFGSGKGVLYVNIRAIEEFVKQRKNNNKKQW